jgi:palmitoyltransferase
MAPFVVGSQKPQARDNTSVLEQRIGLATAVIMPLLEFGAIGYVTWVLCYLICVQYLIDPSDELRFTLGIQPRRSTGIALIVIYAILLLMLLVPWMRLLQVIWTKPDILRPAEPTKEKKDADSGAIEQYDAYICDYEGVPLFCEKCRIFKPDRTHHCKELGRCVRKMDHFCPWAGGIVAETTHKYFMQFVFFGALFTTYLWLVVAIFLADRSSKVSPFRTYTGKIPATDTAKDWLAPRNLDRSTCCGSPLLYIYIDHDLHDRLQPGYQLYLCRGDSKGRYYQHCISDLKNAKRASTAEPTTFSTPERR